MQEATESELIIGRVIKTLRLHYHKDTNEVADIIGISKQQMWKYESGECRLPLVYFLKIISYLGAEEKVAELINEMILTHKEKGVI